MPPAASAQPGAVGHGSAEVGEQAHPLLWDMSWGIRGPVGEGQRALGPPALPARLPRTYPWSRDP